MRTEMIASRIGHAKGVDNDKRRINDELLQMSLNTMDKIKLCRKVVMIWRTFIDFLDFKKKT